MSENNHKLGILIPKASGYCASVQVCIDRERINNAIGLYPIDECGRRIPPEEKMDLEFDVAELEVMDIGEIARFMNEETFEKFCNLWREYHGQQ